MIKKTLGVILLSLFFPLQQLSAAVVINEVFPKPTDDTSEWIELYNNGSESVSLDRWSVENKSGGKFSMNASSIIPANGFLTITQSQSGIKLSNDGDTVKLTDTNGNQMDSQSYQGILGFNTSMGRSTDGGGNWAICTISTEGKANTCPAPTPTSTPLPTPIPSATIVPTAELLPSPLPTGVPIIPQPTSAPLIVVTPTATPVPVEMVANERMKSLGWVLFGLGIAWGSIVLVALIHHAIKNRKKS